LTETPDPGARNYVSGLTGLRGVAALFVLLFHYHHFNPDIRLDLAIPVLGVLPQFPLAFGFMGVDLFFVLSGFLLTLPFASFRLGLGPAPRLRRYFRRRFLRVFPAYWAQLLIILAAGAWLVAWKPISGWSWLAHLTMFFNIGPDPVRPMVGVWWTLPVEFSFYLALPLIAWFMRPARWWVFLLLAIGLSLLYRYWAIQHFPPGNKLLLAISHLPGSLPEFLLGSSAAMLVQLRRLSHKPPPGLLWLDLALLAAMAATGLWFWQVVLGSGDEYWQGHWALLLSPLVTGLLLSVVVLTVYQGSRVGRFLFANRPVYWLGLISYSLYLWHFVVMQQLVEWLADKPYPLTGLVRFLVFFTVVVAVSTASYWLFERPFFRLRPDPAGADKN
jgi:peptidoglycan/LPS O-acetylase OafA/YrhL